MPSVFAGAVDAWFASDEPGEADAAGNKTDGMSVLSLGVTLDEWQAYLLSGGKAIPAAYRGGNAPLTSKE